MGSINGISYYRNKCQTLSNTSRMTFFSFRKTAHQQPRAERIDYKIYGVIQQHEYESWVKKTEEIKERLVEFWQCTDTAFERKNAIFVFPVLPGSAEAHVIWGGIVECFLIANFMGNISAKKISKSVHECQL